MGRRMIRLELEQRFELQHRVLGVSRPFLRQPQLKPKGVHGRIDLLGLLEGLDRLSAWFNRRHTQPIR